MVFDYEDNVYQLDLHRAPKKRSEEAENIVVEYSIVTPTRITSLPAATAGYGYAVGKSYIANWDYRPDDDTDRVGVYVYDFGMKNWTHYRLRGDQEAKDLAANKFEDNAVLYAMESGDLLVHGTDHRNTR